jgi:hypothetical protein
VSNIQPPTNCPGTPELETLRAGTVVVRIHRITVKEEVLDGNTFNTTPATNPQSGGRFDHTSVGEGFLYAGESLEVAVAEVLLRDLPATPAPRIVPLRNIKGRAISRLRVERDISLVSLRGKGLSQLGQDPWLTSCDAVDYPTTRAWAAAIRSWVPAAGGFAWRSRRYQEALAYVLYKTRVAQTDLAVVDTRSADVGSGLADIQKILADHLAVLA